MNIRWLFLQWTAIERERLIVSYDRHAAAGSGSAAQLGGDASRIWSRNLSKIQERIRKLH